MELLKNQMFFKSGPADDIESEEGNINLPRKIEDVDKINLGNVVAAANPKMYNKLLK